VHECDRRHTHAYVLHAAVRSVAVGGSLSTMTLIIIIIIIIITTTTAAAYFITVVDNACVQQKNTKNQSRRGGLCTTKHMPASFSTGVTASPHSGPLTVVLPVT